MSAVCNCIQAEKHQGVIIQSCGVIYNSRPHPAIKERHQHGILRGSHFICAQSRSLNVVVTWSRPPPVNEQLLRVCHLGANCY